MSMVVVSDGVVFAQDQVLTSSVLDKPSLQVETVMQAKAPLKQGRKAVKKAATSYMSRILISTLRARILLRLCLWQEKQHSSGYEILFP